jgi:MFS family permease
MKAYLARMRRAPRAMKLFVAYTLLVNIGFGVFQLIYNLYLVRLGFREDFIGTLTAINTILIAIAALVFGQMVNRFGSWRCIIVGTVLTVISLLGQSLITYVPVLVVFAAIGGIGQAGLIVPNMPFIIEHSSDEERADLSALTFSIMSLSMTMGALVGGRVPELLGLFGSDFAQETILNYRTTLLTGVVLAATALLPLLMIKEQRRGVTTTSGRLADSQMIPRRVRNDMIVFVAVGALFSVSAAAIIPFFNVYLKELGSSAATIGTVFAVTGVFGALLGICAPALARRYGVLAMAAGARFIGVPLLVLLVFVPGLQIAFAAHIVRGVAMALAWPLDSNLIAEVLPNRQRAIVFSYRSASWNLSWAIASFAVGKLIVSTNSYNVSFLTSAVFACLSIGLFTIYFARHPHIAAERAKREAALLPGPAHQPIVGEPGK